MTTKVLETINIHKNLFGSMEHMVKNIDPQGDCLISVIDNKLVRVCGKIVNKKKRRGKMYYFKDQKLAYV